MLSFSMLPILAAALLRGVEAMLAIRACFRAKARQRLWRDDDFEGFSSPAGSCV